MTKYSDWYEKQPHDFIDEISNGDITTHFIDYNCRKITLVELEALDEQFIHKERK